MTSIWDRPSVWCFPEGPEENYENFIKEGQFEDQDLKYGPRVYETGKLT
jgi:hypothetical protein